MKPRLGWLLVAVLWLHQVAVAFLSPLSAQDWVVGINGPSWKGGLYHWVIVKSHLAHVAVTPLLVIALPLGLATLARGRRLRADGEDALLVAAIASALWLAVPRFGVACSYRLAVATHVIGLTAAVWYVIWLRAIAARARAGEPISTRATAGLALAGVVAGDTPLPVGIATILACVMIAGHPGGTGARRWTIPALSGLVAGAAIARWADLVAVINHVHHLDRNIDGQLQAFNFQMHFPAWIGTGAVALWLVDTVWRQWRGRAARPLADHDLDVILRGIGLALATAATGIATTDFTSFQALAPGAAVAVIAAIVVVHLARASRVRFALVGLALAIQAHVIVGSISALVVAHRQFDERVAVLRRTPPGAIATVAPYPLDGETWFFGEDFQSSTLRDRVATLTFGLRGIALAPARREFQDVPDLALHHEVDGDANGLPSFYSADLATARRQFTLALRRRASRARLVVDHLAVPDRPGEPVLAAWTDAAKQVVSWTLTGRETDRQGQLRLIPSGNGLDGDGRADRVIGMWSFDLATGAAQVLRRGDDGVHRLPVEHRMNAGVVACTAERCALVGVLTVR